MRELIRPALFMLARLGLSIAVVAWIIGQWWVPIVYVDHHGEFGIAVRHSGWELNCFRSRGRWHGGFLCQSREFVDTWEASLPPTDPLYRQPEHEWGLFGFSFGFNPSTMAMTRLLVWRLAIRHWLVVTVFALFYGVLKWVYRERGTKVEADE